MQNYLDLMKDILENGHHHEDRTGVGRISLYGKQLRFDLREGFPLVTTRKIYYQGVFKEMLWLIQGRVDNKTLNDQGVHIWDQWAVSEEDVDAFMNKPHVLEYIKHNKSNFGFQETDDSLKIRDEIVTHLKNNLVGILGPIYGAGWRCAPVTNVSHFAPQVTEDKIASDKLEIYKERYAEVKEQVSWEEYLRQNYYSHIDQLQILVYGLKNNPYSSRHIVSAWIPEWVPFDGFSPQENVILGRGALASCHCMFQCFVQPTNLNKSLLHLHLYIRSSDGPVGLPSNIAQYALLHQMLAQVCNYEAAELIITLGDAHIYSDQVELMKEQLTRTPLEHKAKLILNPEVKDLFTFKIEDIRIEGYQHLEPLRYPVAK